MKNKSNEEEKHSALIDSTQNVKFSDNKRKNVKGKRKSKSKQQKSIDDKSGTYSSSDEASSRGKRRKSKKAKDSQTGKAKIANRKSKKKVANSSFPMRSSIEKKIRRGNKNGRNNDNPDLPNRKSNKKSKKAPAVDKGNGIELKGLPIITEEDNESNFSESYIPTTFNTSTGKGYMNQFYLY
ncbi:DEAD/DEAH box helicase domain-containing protein, partial [Reticulomyxa filosa]